jgi:hypothetical protein
MIERFEIEIECHWEWDYGTIESEVWEIMDSNWEISKRRSENLRTMNYNWVNENDELSNSIEWSLWVNWMKGYPPYW